MLLALGGPSGVGKTTIVHGLKRKSDRVRTFLAFTTRPPRPEEQERVDYYFRTEKDMEAAKRDPRYGGFVEARGNWYWKDIEQIHQVIENDPSCLYLFVLTQRSEFEEHKRFFPELKWIWIYADEQEITRRLHETGREIASSLQHNRKLQEEEKRDLVDLYVENAPGKLEETLNQILRFWQSSSSVS